MSIFWDISKANAVEELPFPIITEGTQDCGNGVYLLKAGTPISEERAVANDGDAVMLVAEDFYFYSNTPAQPKLVKCVVGGYVDLTAAEAASGLTYTDAAKSVLEEAGITLVDGKLPAGGGGGGVLVIGIDPNTNTLDKTWQEIFDAGFAVARESTVDSVNWYYVSSASEYEDTEYDAIVDGMRYVTDSPDGYPTLE